MVNEMQGNLSEHVHTLTRQSQSGERWIDLSVSPEYAEELGTAIAKRVAEYDPQLIVTWMLPDEAVLAHIVARILGISSAHAELDLGLITVDRELCPSMRILLLTTIDDQYRRLNSLNTLFIEHGHTVVAAVSVLSTGDPLLVSAAPQFA